MHPPRLWLGIAALGLLSASCSGAIEEPLGHTKATPESGALSDGIGVQNFSWVIDEQLAGMAKPGTYNSLSKDLKALHTVGIKLLVSLTPTPLPPAEVQHHGMEPLHLPVKDFTAPTLEQLFTFVDRTSQSLAKNEAVGVHCAAGQGRTGTFLAVYFVSLGHSAEAAMAKVRELRPGSIETAAQEQVIRDFEQAWHKRAPSGDSGSGSQ